MTDLIEELRGIDMIPISSDGMVQEPVDVPLLRKGVDWVLEQNARDLDESEWDQETWRIDGETIDRSCGTAYCLAGYVCHVSGLEWISDLHVVHQGRAVSPGNAARSLLGLTAREAGVMFAGRRTAQEIVKLAEYVAERAGERL